jgi:hypothetical protein
MCDMSDLRQNQFHQMQIKHCGANMESLIFELYSIHWRSRGQNKYCVNNLQISCTPNAGEAEPKYFEIFLKLFDLGLLAKPSQTCNFGLPRRRVGLYKSILGDRV